MLHRCYRWLCLGVPGGYGLGMRDLYMYALQLCMCYTEKAPNARHRRGTQKTGNIYNQLNRPSSGACARVVGTLTQFLSHAR